MRAGGGAGVAASTLGFAFRFEVTFSQATCAVSTSIREGTGADVGGTTDAATGGAAAETIVTTVSLIGPRGALNGSTEGTTGDTAGGGLAVAIVGKLCTTGTAGDNPAVANVGKLCATGTTGDNPAVATVGKLCTTETGGVLDTADTAAGGLLTVAVGPEPTDGK